MGKVIATCTSEIKGVQKKNVHQVCLIEDYGIEGDAHAGKWHRQVSLLSYDRIQEFRARGAKVEDGAFGENLVVEGIDFKTLPIEPMITEGSYEVVWLDDDWTVMTEDGGWAAHYENTILITEGEPEILSL